MRYLVQLALGPVQEFILNARRTRDLWFGSHLLSELSRAVARHLSGLHFDLVFPALTPGHPELAACSGLFRANHQEPLGISNIIVALSPACDEAAVCGALAAARQAAIKHWKNVLGPHAAQAVAGLLRPDGHVKIVDAIDDALECVAAWEPLADPADTAQVKAARRALAQRIAGRKNLRDFRKWTGDTLPKSSLDGFRETVFDEGAVKETSPVMRRYRIGASEHLDGLGVVKRAGGTPEQFVPLARVALAPWIDAVSADPAFAIMRAELAEIIGQTTLATVSLPREHWSDGFSFDGEVFLEAQWKNHVAQTRPHGRNGLLKNANPHAAEAYDHFTASFVRPLLRRRTPDPYIAVLVADGDRMGLALDAAAGVLGLQAASQACAAFSQSARATIELHSGSLIYAGGDDVLAFVPVTSALEAAAALAASFREHILGAQFPPTVVLPTLSVGIGIGHVLTPMGELLELGRQAEKLAKRGDPKNGDPERNALAIISERRGGARVQLRRPWNPRPEAVAQNLLQLVDAWSQPWMPRGLPYEVRALLRRLPEKADGPHWAAILDRELANIHKRKDLQLSWLGLGLDLAGTDYASMRKKVGAWIDDVLVLRHLTNARDAVDRAGAQA